MMDHTFVEHHTRRLIAQLASSNISFKATTRSRQDPQALEYLDQLQALVVSLESPLTPKQVRDNLGVLVNLEQNEPEYVAQLEPDSEEAILKKCIVDRITLGLYSEALKVFMGEAVDVQGEADWWADVERSRWNVSWYLLQTVPLRTFNLFHTILHTFRTKGLPLHPFLFTPASLKRVFSSQSFLHPNVLFVALFPHLQHRPLAATLFQSRPTHLLNRCLGILIAPLELARQECRLKRKELEKMRDERAEALGELVEMREALEAAVYGKSSIQSFVLRLRLRVADWDSLTPMVVTPGSKTVASLQLLSTTLSLRPAIQVKLVESHGLLRPSRLTLLWPRILLFPPLIVYGAKTLYASRASLKQIWVDTKETLNGFVRGWLVDPLKEVIKTVRAGGEGGVIVQKEAVSADIDSLERMTLALAKDRLRYDDMQLRALSEQVRTGNLTPVLQIYEEDIKSPLKSALTGALLRSVFIQVQKAKVDIDQTLTGIDKLLKSQELTFAFVGVAPALAIVYLLGGFLRTEIWGRGNRSRFGGSRRRRAVWVDMRRIERLLIVPPQLTVQPPISYSSSPVSLSSSESAPSSSPAGIPRLTMGLLLMSLARLRIFALRELRGGMRDGFLTDVEDLEEVGLGREDKLRVVERMWRGWGGALGWGRMGEGG